MKTSFVNPEKEMILCQCQSDEHVILYEKDEGDALVYLSPHLADVGFFKRVVLGIKYIFGHKSKYGHFESVVLSDIHIDKLQDIINHLNPNIMSYTKGETVNHPRLGTGIVLEGDSSKATVKFESGVTTEVAQASLSTVLHS